MKGLQQDWLESHPEKVLAFPMSIFTFSRISKDWIILMGLFDAKQAYGTVVEFLLTVPKNCNQLAKYKGKNDIQHDKMG